MKSINKILAQSSQKGFGLVCKDIDHIPRCKVCNEPIGIVVNMAFGTRIYPRACRCKREQSKKNEIEDINKQKQIRLKQIVSKSMMNKNFKEYTLANWDHEIGNENLYKIAKF